MLILTIRTDKPEAEIGLYDYDHKVDYEIWHAHRQLSATIHTKISSLLEKHNADWQALSGVIVFAGPGSFTGLRIGVSVANALGASLNKPVIGTSDDNWISEGIQALKHSKNDNIIVPKYGQAAKVTKPRK